MPTYCLMLLVTLTAAAGNEQVIDAFQYADSEAARGAGMVGTGTPPVEAVEADGRRVLQFHAPFAASLQLERTILDRDVNLDLAAVGEFALDIAAEHPQAAGRVSLYFRAGDGWYSAGAGLVKDRWQTLRFSKASFRIEDRPAGWHKVDGIRISVWRGQPKDSAFQLGRLVAKWHDVALVIPAAHAHEGDREIETLIAARSRLSVAAVGILGEVRHDRGAGLEPGSGG